ncbi:MAG: S41 family peptidase [Clostridia bacterium]|nr:S41 family peptidase [Clostridia bacterium]
MKKKIVITAVCLTITAFVAAVVMLLLRYGSNFGIYLIKPTPQAYGERALSFMEYGYYTDSDDWKKARSRAQEQLQNAESFEDTYPILRKAVSVAGGKHSALRLPSELETFKEESKLPLVSVDSMQNGIVTVVLPAYSQDAGKKEEYAQIVISWLREHTDAKGVIVDLRGNTGGDMAPMVAAVSPLLPDGDVLGYQYANGQTNYLTLKNGAFNGGSGITVDSFKMPEQLPIAILTDEWTASSGEAVLVAFRGMENVRTFGAATAGYVSVNTVYQLYDGVQLWLTIAADVAPRTSEVFCEDPISPDVLTDEPEKEAAAWIESVKEVSP